MADRLERRREDVLLRRKKKVGGSFSSASKKKRKNKGGTHLDFDIGRSEADEAIPEGLERFPRRADPLGLQVEIDAYVPPLPSRFQAQVRADLAPNVVPEFDLDPARFEKRRRPALVAATATSKDPAGEEEEDFFEIDGLEFPDGTVGGGWGDGVVEVEEEGEGGGVSGSDRRGGYRDLGERRGKKWAQISKDPFPKLTVLTWHRIQPVTVPNTFWSASLFSNVIHLARPPSESTNVPRKALAGPACVPPSASSRGSFPNPGTTPVIGRGSATSSRVRPFFVAIKLG